MILSLGTLGGPAAGLVCIRPYAFTSEPIHSASFSTVLSPDRANLHVPVGHARRHCFDLKVQEAGSPQQHLRYSSLSSSKTNPPLSITQVKQASASAMAGAGIFARFGALFLRILQFCCAAVGLGIFSYFLAVSQTTEVLLTHCY